MKLFDEYKKLIEDHASILERMRSMHDEIFGKFFPEVKKELSFDDEKDSESGNTHAEADDDFVTMLDNYYLAKDTKKSCKCCKCKDKVDIKIKEQPILSKKEQQKRDKKLVKRIHEYLLQSVNNSKDKSLENVERGERDDINPKIGKGSKLTRTLNALVAAMNDYLYHRTIYDKEKMHQALLIKTMFYLLGITKAEAETLLSTEDSADSILARYLNEISLNSSTASAALRVRDFYDRARANVLATSVTHKRHGNKKEVKKVIEVDLGNSQFEIIFNSISNNYSNFGVKSEVYLTINDPRYGDEEMLEINGNIDFYCVLETLVRHITDAKVW